MYKIIIRPSNCKKIHHFIENVMKITKLIKITMENIKVKR